MSEPLNRLMDRIERLEAALRKIAREPGTTKAILREMAEDALNTSTRMPPINNDPADTGNQSNGDHP
jgi:hypothetical protein